MYTNFPLYPTSIFSNTDYPAQADNTDTVYAALINALKTEMQACFDELGTLPKGFHVSVKARIEALEAQLKIIIDSMEYASNAAAQAAYVSSDASSYSANILTGGTASAEQVDNGAAANAVDGDEDTHWGTNTAVYSLPTWWKYDLGVGTTKTARKCRLKNYSDGASVGVKDFKIQGSNNSTDGSDGDWDDLATGLNTSDISGMWTTFDFANTTAYEWIRLIGAAQLLSGSDYYIQVREIEMYEALPAQCYSESSIKEQGDYSMKIIILTGHI